MVLSGGARSGCVMNAYKDFDIWSPLILNEIAMSVQNGFLETVVCENSEEISGFRNSQTGPSGTNTHAPIDAPDITLFLHSDV